VITGPIEITPWWLRLLGRKPFRQEWCLMDEWGWEYLSFHEAIQKQEARK
jgi:hypothetical protein